MNLIASNCSEDWQQRRAEQRKQARVSAEHEDWPYERAKMRERERERQQKADWLFQRGKQREENRRQQVNEPVKYILSLHTYRCATGTGIKWRQRCSEGFLAIQNAAFSPPSYTLFILL